MKRISILILAIVIIIIVLVVFIATQRIFNLSEGKEKSNDQIISTISIEQRDLRTFEKIDGVLEYGSEVQVLPSNNGVLTHIIPEGADVLRGTVLFKYYKSVTDSEILTVNNQFASADSAVAQAEAALESLISGPTDSQIASADSAVAQAEAALVNSQALTDTQWVTFRIARESYCDFSGKSSSSAWTAEVYKSVCPDTEKVMTETAAELLLDSMFNGINITSSNDLLIAYENHKKAVEAEVSSTKSLKAAKAQRSALDDNPTVADLNKANKALESAKASLKLASHNKDEVVEGISGTVAMYGQKPAWRSFEIGMPDGLDIFQLEQNLVALGYDETNSILIDQEFDEHTRKAIETMQSSFGFSVTGELKFRDILFVPGPSVVQYSDSHAEIGASIIASKSILSLIPIEKIIKNTVDREITKSLQKVNTSIAVANQDLVELGLLVSIELPNENVISGTISEIGDIAVIPQGNQEEPYLEIVVSLEDTESLPEWTGATVTVSVTKQLASGVLAVPVTSLLAILGGGYAIEIIENNVSTLVPVSVGLYADGWVEIKGDGIKVGTEVMVP